MHPRPTPYCATDTVTDCVTDTAAMTRAPVASIATTRVIPKATLVQTPLSMTTRPLANILLYDNAGVRLMPTMLVLQ